MLMYFSGNQIIPVSIRSNGHERIVEFSVAKCEQAKNAVNQALQPPLPQTPRTHPTPRPPQQEPYGYD